MESDPRPRLKCLATYADDAERPHPPYVEVGHGLLGQAAAERQRLLITELPADAVPIGSTMFKAVPRAIVVLPVGAVAQVVGLRRRAAEQPGDA